MTAPFLQTVLFGGRRAVVWQSHELQVAVHRRMAERFLVTTALFRFLAFSTLAPTRPYVRLFRLTTITPVTPVSVPVVPAVDMFGNLRRTLLDLLGQGPSAPTTGPGRAITQTPASGPTPPTPTPGGTTPPDGSPPSGPPGGTSECAGEASWKAIGPTGLRQIPVPVDRLWRDSDEGYELMVKGLAAPGTDFDMVRHQRRTTSRGDSDDAFYGSCRQSRYEGDVGPLHGIGRYLVLMVNAYGVDVESKRSEHLEIIEWETVVHIVPPWKIVAVMDKTTGVVKTNPLSVSRGMVTAAELEWLKGLMERQYATFLKDK